MYIHTYIIFTKHTFLIPQKWLVGNLWFFLNDSKLKNMLSNNNRKDYNLTTYF